MGAGTPICKCRRGCRLAGSVGQAVQSNKGRSQGPGAGEEEMSPCEHCLGDSVEEGALGAEKRWWVWGWG